MTITASGDEIEPVSVTVTNTYDVGGVGITKVVDGTGADSATGPFEFEVTCTFLGSDLSPQPDKAVIADPGGSVTVDGLPVGAECAVVELAPYGGADGPGVVDPGSVVIGSDGLVTVTATNTFAATPPPTVPPTPPPTVPPTPPPTVPPTPPPTPPAIAGSQWIGAVLAAGSLLLELGVILLLAARRRQSVS